MKKFAEIAPNIMLCSFVVWVCVSLCLLFPVFGISISLFVSCFLSIGLKKNIINALQSKNIEIESIFSYFKHSFSSFCLFLCTMFLIIVWSIALFIPGIIVGVNYGFAPFVFAENPELGVLKCLEISKQKTIGKRAEIFILYLLQILFIVLILILVCSFMIILSYTVLIPQWLYYTVPVLLSLVLYFIVIYPYFQMYLANLYLDNNKQQKNIKKKKVRTEIKSDEKVLA